MKILKNRIVGWLQFQRLFLFGYALPEHEEITLRLKLLGY